MKKLILIILGLFVFSYSGFCGSPVIIKKASSYEAPARVTDDINAEVDGHALSIVFTENLGQVSVEVLYASSLGEVETTSVYTPSGVNVYIPNTGSYIVTITLPNGDEYYGEFEVTD